MAEYNMTDKEQVEMLKKWWNDYGKIIAIAVIIGLAVAFGWRYWKRHKIEVGQSASNLYGQLGVADQKKQPKVAEKIAAQLMQDYKSTPYATMAALWWAESLVKDKKYDEALKKTEWVQDNARSKTFKQVARLRTARIQLYQKHYKVALSTLSTVNDKSYAPLAEELKGDVYTAMNNIDAAQKSYKKAQEGFKAADINSPILNMKVAQ